MLAVTIYKAISIAYPEKALLLVVSTKTHFPLASMNLQTEGYSRRVPATDHDLLGERDYAFVQILWAADFSSSLGSESCIWRPCG